MSKEKLRIKEKNNYFINDDNAYNYIKELINVLRRYKDKDNDKTERSYFEIPQCKNISLNDNLTNLGKMISDDSLREIKEESYIKKLNWHNNKKRLQN